MWVFLKNVTLNEQDCRKIQRLVDTKYDTEYHNINFKICKHLILYR